VKVAQDQLQLLIILPTSVISQNDVKKTDVISGSISTSSGDNYFDRTAGTYAA
jgi:hypothetical protein